MTLRINARRTGLAAVTIASLLLAVGVVPIESSRSGAQAWVQSLSAEGRVDFTQPSRISGLPESYRRALFAKLSTSEERAAFWRGVFSEYRQRHQLTPPQVDALRRAESAMTAEMFAPGFDDARNLRISELRQLLIGTLGVERERALFYTAGSEAASALPTAERIRYAWRNWRPQTFVAIANFAIPGILANSIDCDCNESDDCSYEQRCPNPDPDPSCSPTSWGCGPIWTAECWAKCEYLLPPD